MILILGSPDDPHVNLIQDKIRQQAEPAICFDTRQFPTETKLSFFPKHTGMSKLHISGEKIELSGRMEMRSCVQRMTFSIENIRFFPLVILSLFHISWRGLIKRIQDYKSRTDKGE